MAKIIMNIPDDEYYYFMHSEYFDSDDGYDAIVYICNGTVLDNATNGDVIKAMFPNIRSVKLHNEMKEIIDVPNDYGFVRFDLDWWNAPYKAEVR